MTRCDACSSEISQCIHLQSLSCAPAYTGAQSDGVTRMVQLSSHLVSQHPAWSKLSMQSACEARQQVMAAFKCAALCCSTSHAVEKRRQKRKQEVKQDAAGQQAEDAERAAARQKREEEAQLRADSELSCAGCVKHHQGYPLLMAFMHACLRTSITHLPCFAHHDHTCLFQSYIYWSTSMC